MGLKAELLKGSAPKVPFVILRKQVEGDTLYLLYNERLRLGVECESFLGGLKALNEVVEELWNKLLTADPDSLDEELECVLHVLLEYRNEEGV